MIVSQNLFGFEQIEAFSVGKVTPIFEEFRREVEEYLLDGSDDTDSTDGILDFIAELSDKIQKKFDEFTNGDSDKKCFLKNNHSASIYETWHTQKKLKNT